jgi:hypothetical protein
MVTFLAIGSFGRGLLKMQLMLLKLVNLVTLWIPHNQENKLIITRSNLPFRENRIDCCICCSGQNLLIYS